MPKRTRFDLEATTSSMASNIHLSASSQDAAVRKEAADALRADYVRLMGAERLVLTEEIQQAFTAVARDLVDKFEAAPCTDAPCPTELVELRTGAKVRMSKSDVALVGRLEGVDLELNRADPTCSRLHMLVFSLPHAVLVVDVGSTNGIVTVDRSDATRAPETSAPNSRRVLDFAHGESAALRLGADCIVLLNPRTCGLCDRANALNFSCGHFAPCRHCSPRSVVHLCVQCEKWNGAVERLQDGTVVGRKRRREA